MGSSLKVRLCFYSVVFYSAQYSAQRKKNEEEEADRGRGDKTISKSGQVWILATQLGQLKTGQDGKGIAAKSSLVLQRSCKIML